MGGWRCWWRCYIFSIKGWYLLYLRKNTFKTFLISCFGVLLNSMMSSRWTLANCQLVLKKVTSIRHWIFPSALRTPKGIQISWYSPCWKVKTVLSFTLSSSSICHYPVLASSAEKTIASQSESIQLSLRGIVYESCLVATLSLRYSVQN